MVKLMDNISSTPGFYGKLPCRGDFLTRGLSKDFVQPWDTWLQKSFADSRDQLTDAWVDTYLVSPIWHFMLSAHLCGVSSWMGLLMPSVDKVGRYFPLTIAVKLPPQMTVSHLSNEIIFDWFVQADDLALSTLEDNFELALFEQQLTQLGAPTVPIKTAEAPIHAELPQFSENTTWYVPLSSEQEDFSALCQRVQNHLQNGRETNYSIWWTSETEDFPNAFLFCEGLPPTHGFVAFLDGKWQHWKWQLGG